MMIGRIYWGLGLFLGSMALGVWLRRLGALNDEKANRLIRWVIKGPAPLVLCLSFWRMNLRSPEPWLLPVTGLLVACATLLPAWVYAKRARMTRPQTGSFLTSALFSNVGYLGAYLAYALFGETAYALCILYYVFFTPSFYTLGFSIAAHYGEKRRTLRLKDALYDELRLYPFLGMLAGMLLSFLHVPRPLVLEHVNHALINVDTVLDLVALGSQVMLVSPRLWFRPCLAMSGIKFIYTPAIAWMLASLFHIHGLPRMIVLLEASTPVGVSPLMLPLLFGLDRRLSNALWLFTTLAAIPWLLLILPILQHL